eukprot:CFRG1809T1
MSCREHEECKRENSVHNLQLLANNLDFDDRYSTQKILGQGAFSVVFLAKDKITADLVAVKRIKTKYLTVDDLASLDSEIRVMKTLNHPHIVKLIDFFATKHHYYLVQELALGGELFDRVAKKEAYTESEAYDLIKMLLLTIAYIHAKGVVHRDLKPENILLTSQDDDADVKVCDFGFAKQTFLGKQTMNQKKGTPGYIAPEILSNQLYDAKADIWSLGCIFYVLLGGYQPFVDANAPMDAKSDKELEERMKKGEYEFHAEWWTEVSEDAKDLIRKMLVVDPQQRWTAEQLLSLPYFSASPEELRNHDIATSLKQLRRLQARRKLKAGMNTVLSITRLKRSLSREPLHKNRSSSDLKNRQSFTKPNSTESDGLQLYVNSGESSTSTFPTVCSDKNISLLNVEGNPRSDSPCISVSSMSDSSFSQL